MTEFMDAARLMPHGMCLLWREDLLALHVVSDGIIALAYFSIPIALIAFVRRRPSLGHRGVMLMFAAFILLCGATHVVSIWTFWNPDYALQGLLKAVTAAVSIATAMALWPLMPKLLALPAPSELRDANERLAEEVEQRRDAEQRYRELARDLEVQVKERTERLNASRQALAESEARFRAAFDSTRFGLTLGSMDGPWTDVNRAFCEMLGYGHDELMSLNWQEATHPEDRRDTNANAARLLAGEIDHFSMTKRYLRKDGEVLHAVTDVTLIRDEAGEPSFYMSQVQDITEMVALESAVRQSEARASMLIEGASDAIFELDSNGAILSSNQAARDLLGMGAGELESVGLQRLVGREDGVPLNWQGLLAHGNAPAAERPEAALLATHSSGARIPVELRIGSLTTNGDVYYSAIVRDVSDRVASQNALRRAHDELRFHMANSPLAVIVWDADFNILDWSSSAESTFGFTRAEVVGRHPSEFRFVYEEDEEKIVSVMAELSDGSTKRNRLINRNYRKDGNVIHAEWFNSVRTDAEGRVVSILSFVEDVTERVEASRALMASEAHTKAILDTAVDGIISIEPNGTVLALNPAAERIFGYSADEVLGRNIKMLMPQPYRDEHDGYLSNYIHGGERKIIGIGREVTGLRKGGEEFPMELAVSEVRSEGHRTFTGFVRDISERKRFESEIVEGNRQLQEKDWVLSGHASLVTALQGDPSITEIAARTVELLCDYLDANAGVFHAVEPDGSLRALTAASTGGSDAEARSSLALKAAEQQETVTLSSTREGTRLTLRTAFGEIEFARLLAFPIVHEGRTEAVLELAAVGDFHANHAAFLEFVQSSIAVAIASARGREQVAHLLAESREQALALEAQGVELKSANEDLREHGRSLEQKSQELQAAKREIEQKARAVEQANRYKSEFLANMSHELRTPLNSMLVLSRSLAENSQGKLCEADVEAAEVIHRSGQTLLELINDILDLSKVEAGKLTIEPTALDVGDFARQLREQFDPIAKSRGLEFEVSLPDPPGTLASDGLRLEQILRNLLGNAFKFTEEGKVALTVRDLGEEGYEFAVTDTGIGISKELQQRIFEAFQQADGSTRRRYEGTGLGLSISRELGRLLHGELSVTSEPGAGSTFVLRLPRVHPDYVPKLGVETLAEPSPDTPGPRRTRGRDKPGDPQILEGICVLVVDDDYRNSFALSRLLNEHGADVTLADSGEQALERLAEARFDIVLMDVMMPDMNGCEVIREAGRRGFCPSTPVVVVTADTSPETRADAEDAGARACVLKPIDPSELLETLGQELGVAA